VAEVPDDKDYRKSLTDLSETMKDVGQKMRDDRHDESVQVDQKNIDDKLGDMIRELEKMSQMSSTSQRQESEREKQRKTRMAMMGQEKNSQRGGRAGEKLGPAEPPGSAINAPTVVSRTEKWAALPEKERDELLQVFRPEVPLRWRKRLEAYFVSVAAEEARRKSEAPAATEAKPETGN
jgi:TolA-binding protein